MQEVTPVPFYFNWTFWAVTIAALALLLSQLPPIRLMLRHTRLQVKPYDRQNVCHWLGNPNINLHLLLTNEGGREIRVLAMAMQITKDEGDDLVLPGQTFSKPDGSPGSFLLTQFPLKPREDWSNFVSFFSPFSLAEERRSKQLKKDLKKNIQDKLEARSPEEKLANATVEADNQFVTPLLSFFSDHNKWQPGEYTVDLQVKCQPKRASVNRQFRFTLYESDIAELEERTERYKYGAGVHFVDPESTEVFVQLKDLV